MGTLLTKNIYIYMYGNVFFLINIYIYFLEIDKYIYGNDDARH